MSLLWTLANKPQAGNCLRKSVNRKPLPLKVSNFGWNYTFSGGNFPISTVFCDSLSVPNVS